MTVVAVLADPPREGLVLPALSGSPLLSEEEAAGLYEAALKDVVRAVAGSGGDPLVNYRSADSLPDGHGNADPEQRLRSVVEDALDDLRGADAGEVRYEVQVGSTLVARVGNTVTHLLREEGADSAAVCWPTAPLMARTEVDSAAMKLRGSPVVLGPATGGRVYYAGFTEPIDFEGALAPPAVETLVARGVDEGYDADFLPTVPRIDTTEALASTVSIVRARRRAGRRVPEFTAAAIEALDLVVREGDGAAIVARE
ncbi:hypothetical protein BRD00_03935 [Halobacteriales archaeon QS_8_69_26]|nr:MAG: hypothetical protein BRD00_03935 [Halobacteriales archaeon QS_8_69_26]